MKEALRLALRDLRGSKAGLRLLAVCLFLGVAALAGIGSLSTAILTGLSEQGQVILGGDLQAEAAQRSATDEERAAFARFGTLSETTQMRAMAATADGSQSLLIELKGIDANYPLYGRLRLAKGALAARPSGTDVAIAPALAEKLDLKVGSQIRVGDAQFRIMGIIAEEPDRVGEGFTLGPVVMADKAGVDATGLIQPGSLYTSKYRVKMRDGADPAKATASLSKQFAGAGWDYRDRSNGAPGTRRFIERLGQFLALIGLASLAVAGIGVGNGVASWLDGKRESIATLKVLGASSQTIFIAYLAQIILISTAAIMAGLVIGGLVPWVVTWLAGNLLPITPHLDVYPAPLALGALYGLLIALLFSLAPLARARAVTAASLFRDQVETVPRPSWPIVAGMVTIAGLIAALAIITARDPMFAASFIGSVLGLLALLAGLGWLIRRIAAALPRPRAPLARLALAGLHRPGAQTGRLVVALGLGLTLFATLATIQTSLNSAIENTIPKRAPSFFALDIPKDEEARFRSSVSTIAPSAEVVTVPTLRGPVVALNDRRVADMKDVPEEAWFLRGDRGLTFARTIPEGSRITEGQWWPANYAGPPLVSIDERAAKATGLKLGDRLTISVLGVEIEAKIASFREINWDTLGFNFVLVFSPGTLEAAPYTLAATIGTATKSEAAISRAVSNGFPSVSMIRVKDVVTQVGDLMRQLGSAIAVAASVAVLAGIAVLMGAVAAARRSRSYDAVLLKLLGATRFQVLTTQAIEYAILATILSLVALAIGSAAGWYVVTRIFELEWAPDLAIVIGTVAAGGVGTLVLALIGALPVLSARPSAALRAL
ncbi:ABC transporter permease [Aquisediminimonas profunda]|uniref:ABC transporter permease n=1 Tax=Aquisediminimonas profunda TaxID=1550733 RepID=UPI001C62DBFB|nr:FtsX-like permease family protein [Aquisediminimonas profunda]